MNWTLAELQKLLYRLITAPADPEEVVAREHALQESGLEAVILGNRRLSAHDRLGIYANAYFYRLLDIFKEEFPCTYAVLGDITFHNLITGYLIEYPPSEPSVFYAGCQLPHYVKTVRVLPGISASQLPYLADLARLERACIEVFHGADAEALEQQSLSDISPESWPLLRIRLHPAVQILDLDWRIDVLIDRDQGGPAMGAAGIRCRHYYRVEAGRVGSLSSSAGRRACRAESRCRRRRFRVNLCCSR
jgi:hypothetical protein